MTNRQGPTPDHELGAVYGDKDMDHLSQRQERAALKRDTTGQAGNSDLGDALRESGVAEGTANDQNARSVGGKGKANRDGAGGRS